MIINFLQTLIDPRNKEPFVTSVPVRGEYLKNPDGSFMRGLNGGKITEQKDIEITLQWISGQALGLHFDDEKNLDIEEKRKRAKLIDKIYEFPESCELDEQQIALISRLIAKAFPVAVFGAAAKLLNGGNKDEKGEIN